MGHHHGHGHGLGHDPADRPIRPLVLALGITATFLVVEFAGAALTGSLALLSDAGHMLTDVAGLTMATVAATMANRSRASGRRTFGHYRLEILAALGNAVLLLALATYLVVTSIRRLGEPVPLDAVSVMLIAAAGLLANGASLWILRPVAEQNLNTKAAHTEVLADLVSTLSVMAGAVLILVTGWYWVDTLVALGIACFVLPRAARLAYTACGVLLQHAPSGLDVRGLERSLAGIDGVQEIHDLHVWTLTSGMDVLSVHVLLAPGSRVCDLVRRDVHAVLREGWGISHATVQVEDVVDDNCLDLTW